MTWLVALLVPLCWALREAADQGSGVEKIEKCGVHCSKGLQCKTKPHDFFSPPCQSSPEGLISSSVFLNVSLSTVMSCEGRQKCSLHLRVSTVLKLTEPIHGVSICTVTAGMLEHCKVLRFSKNSRERMAGQQVNVESDCFDVFPGQEVRITLKTLPLYCGITWTSTYQVPACNTGELRSHIPECITGRLSYDVNPEKKELIVNVSDMLEDKDYHLRLCHKGYICRGTGSSALITKEEPVKKATLVYSRPLPCICIEGWSAMTDASRVQVCPFKDRLEELWFGVNFDPVEETLSWEPACPVVALASLCQKGDDGVCVDLPHASQNVSREKITFTKVDPHPQLCMKFTVGPQSWTRCPFIHGKFQASAWDVVVTERAGHEEIVMLSQITASFSVSVCVKSEGSPACRPIDGHTVHVVKQESVGFNLTGNLCKPNSCLQVKRLDVTYGATIIHCHLQCKVQDDVRAGVPTPAVSEAKASLARWEVPWVIVPVGACLSAIIMVSLVLHLMLTVYQRKRNKLSGDCASEKHAGICPAAINCGIPAFQTLPALHRQVYMPDSLQLGNFEKANLLSN